MGGCALLLLLAVVLLPFLAVGLLLGVLSVGCYLLVIFLLLAVSLLRITLLAVALLVVVLVLGLALVAAVLVVGVGHFVGKWRWDTLGVKICVVCSRVDRGKMVDDEALETLQMERLTTHPSLCSRTSSYACNVSFASSAD